MFYAKNFLFHPVCDKLWSLSRGVIFSVSCFRNVTLAAVYRIVWRKENWKIRPTSDKDLQASVSNIVPRTKYVLSKPETSLLCPQQHNMWIQQWSLYYCKTFPQMCGIDLESRGFFQLPLWLLSLAYIQVFKMYFISI